MEGTQTSAARTPQLAITLFIGGLSVTSLILFGLGISQALMAEHGTLSELWSRTSFVIASTAAVMATILACRYAERAESATRHAEIVGGLAAAHALLEQFAAKFDRVGEHLDQIDEKIENQKWDIFGELAINAGSNVVKFPQPSNGHHREH